MSAAPHPVHVELDGQAGILSMEWSDGVQTDYSLKYLRGWCPCAQCQGHFQGIKKFIDHADATLLDVEPVGGYAMRLRWLDGHQSGIYTFKYLLEIYRSPPGGGMTNQEMLLND